MLTTLPLANLVWGVTIRTSPWLTIIAAFLGIISESVVLRHILSTSWQSAIAWSTATNIMSALIGYILAPLILTFIAMSVFFQGNSPNQPLVFIIAILTSATLSTLAEGIVVSKINQDPWELHDWLKFAACNLATAGLAVLLTTPTFETF